MFDSTSKFQAIAQLAALADDHPDLAAGITALIVQLLGVKTTPERVPYNEATVNATELFIYRSDGKITAIKAYRERTGLGLKESKDAIEAAAKDVFGVPEGRFAISQVIIDNRPYNVACGRVNRADLGLVPKSDPAPAYGNNGNSF